MKFKILIPLVFIGISLHAQNNIDQLLAAGLEDAKQFSDAYISPASEGLIFSLSNGWYNSGKGKNIGQFEISIIGNASFVNDDDKNFQLNTADYNFLQFEDPTLQKMNIATVFGENDPDIHMRVNYENPDGSISKTEILLPQGVGSVGVNVIPTGYLQASIGLLKGTEVKLRYLPSIKTEDVSTSFYGGAIQHEVTSWISGADLFPLHISALVGYTAFDGSYDLEDNNIVDGDNQQIETKMDSWLFTAIISTKLPIINFYGGFGYVSGSSETNLTGTFHVKEGVLSQQTVTDPYSISNSSGGIKATLGSKLKLGFFRINADYSFQKFSTVSLGLNFGI